MNELTQILQRFEKGYGKAAAELLPLIYEELRKLAAARMAQEAAGQTLQLTAKGRLNEGAGRYVQSSGLELD